MAALWEYFYVLELRTLALSLEAVSSHGQWGKFMRTAFLLWLSCLLDSANTSMFRPQPPHVKITQGFRLLSAPVFCTQTKMQLRCPWCTAAITLSKTLVNFLFHRTEPIGRLTPHPSVQCVSAVSRGGKLTLMIIRNNIKIAIKIAPYSFNHNKETNLIISFLKGYENDKSFHCQDLADDGVARKS